MIHNAGRNEIEKAMYALQNEEQVPVLMRFFKTGKGQYGEGDKFLGIKVPYTRNVAKQYWKLCTQAQVEDMITSPYHEIRLCALLIVVQKYRHATGDEERKMWVDFYLAHTAYINNWDLVDLSCYEILGPWYSSRDKQVLYNMARTGHMWEQRIAMVSTMNWVRSGKYEDCLRIADILLHHEHDLIHKAVGWLLREVGKRNEPLLKDYLRTRYSGMPRTTLRYAIEKFSPEERAKYIKGQI